MANTAILSVRIVGDAKNGVQALQQTESAVGKMGTAVKAGAAIAGAALVAAGAAAIKFGADAVSAAGDLEQSTGAIDAVFKGSAGQMHAWSKEAATAVGLTQNEFNELGTLIGTQLKNGGTAMEELAPKTNNLIGLGADLSAMFGGTTADAVGALSSALKGERDPIEKYGVSLNQAAIDAKAAEMGFAKVGGSLTTEANQAATLALIMDQTADAHGRFAAESDTLQGKQQRLTAQLENVKTAIGTALLPIVVNIIDVFATKWMPVIQNAGTQIAQFISALDFSGILNTLTAAFGGTTGAVTPLNTAIASLVQWFNVQLVPAVTAVAQALAAHFQMAVTTVTGIVSDIMTRLAPLTPTISGIFSTIGSIIATSLQLAAEAVRLGTAAIKAAWDIIGPPIVTVVTATFSAIVNIIGPALSTVQAIISTVLAVIRGDWSGAWEGVKGIASSAWSTIQAIISGAINIVKSVISSALSIISSSWSAAWSTIKSLASSAWSGITSAISSGVSRVLGYFRQLPGQVASALSGMGGKLRTVGTQMIQGLIGGISSMASRAANAAKNVVQGAITGAKRLLGIESPSKVFAKFGQQTGEGFIKGLGLEERGVARAGANLVGAAIPSRLPTINAKRSSSGTAGPSINLEVNFNGLVTDPLATAREIERVLKNYIAVTGRPIRGVA